VRRGLNVYLRPEFGLFLLVFLVYSATLVGYMNSLDGPQYALTRALAEDQSIHIEKYEKFAWPDYALGSDGRSVSDREAGPSILAVPFHYLGKVLHPYLRLPYDGDRPKLSAETKTQVVTYASLVFIISLGLAYAYVLLKRLGMSSGSAFVTCLLIAFGTLMWKYSASFARQPAVGILLLLAVLELLLYSREKGAWRLLLTGVFSGLALLHDYMVAMPLVLIAGVFVYVERPRPRMLLPAVLGFAPFALVALVYNYFAFGELLTSPHEHEAQVTWMHSFWNSFRTPTHIGLYLNIFSFRPIPDSAMQWLIDRPDVYFQMGVRGAQTLTYKGLFVQSPFLLFALGGWVFLAGRSWRLVLYPAAVVMSWLLLMSSVTIFWGSAAQHDGRYLLPFVPVLAVGLGFFIDAFIRDKSSATARGLAWLLMLTALVSLYFGWESSVTNFAPNLSGDHRWSPDRLLGPTGVTADSLATAFLETFPNVYSLYALIPLGFLLYGAAYAAFYCARRAWAASPFDLPGEQITRVSLTRDVPAGALRVWLVGGALVAGVTLLAIALEPFGDNQHVKAVTAQASAPTGGATERNETRMDDLEKLKFALLQYEATYAALPDNRGKLQTVCTYESLDEGCKLESLLSPLPNDPIGRNFGYWYISDGDSFTLVALWEGDASPPEKFVCPERVRTQVQEESRICLRSD
jgi:hypothetical protein